MSHDNPRPPQDRQPEEIPLHVDDRLITYIEKGEPAEERRLFRRFFLPRDLKKALKQS